MSKPTLLFNSFAEYFEDFLELLVDFRNLQTKKQCTSSAHCFFYLLLLISYL